MFLRQEKFENMINIKPDIKYAIIFTIIKHGNNKESWILDLKSITKCINISDT